MHNMFHFPTVLSFADLFIFHRQDYKNMVYVCLECFEGKIKGRYWSKIKQ